MSDETGARRRVLVLAYYFPPLGLSGVQRTAKFVKYLPEFGWEPTVLTCEPRGYFAYDQTLLKEVEEAGIRVVRTRSWDPTMLFRRGRVVVLPGEARRQWLSAASQFVFIPDNKIGWLPRARRAALRLMKEESFDVIFSTAPPYSAHLLGRSIVRKSGLPLVLDFRDDWLGNPRHVYPTSLHRYLSTALERRALRSSQKVVVINEEIRKNLAFRNEGVIRSEDVVVIPQGYDPADFERPQPVQSRARFTLLYSGIFYDAQTPDYFLQGLADLFSRRSDLRKRVEAVFVGLLPESAKKLADELHISSAVRHVGYAPHDEVIDHLQQADVLWMMVGRAEGSETISTSKLFEYFGTRKPILGLVPDGAAKTALQRYGAAEIVDPYSVPEISASIERLYEKWESASLPAPAEEAVQPFDRRRLAKRLAEVLDGVV